MTAEHTVDISLGGWLVITIAVLKAIKVILEETR